MSFHEILATGAPLVGTFVKTPHHSIVEVLGTTSLDFIILDAEHSTFDVADLDRCTLAARAMKMPVLVRLTDGNPSSILRILDLGAAGFLVPHITTAEQATALVRAANYGAGGRGYSATNRAGNYGGQSMPDHLAASRNSVVVPQIEDPEAVDNIEAIAAVPGISALFVGPADLAVAYGVNDLKSPRVTEAVDRVIEVAKQHGVPVATFAPTMEAAPGLFARGIAMLAIASEHKPMQDFFSTAAIAAVKTKD